MLTKIFFILAIIVQCFNLHANTQENKELSFSTNCDSRNKEITISFVGDILIHKALYEATVKETKYFYQIWKNTIPQLLKADFSVGNLEGPAALGIDRFGNNKGDIGFIYDGEVYSGTNFVFNYHPQIFADLNVSGFDLMTAANNHSMDRLSIGMDKTILAANNIDFPLVGVRLSNKPNNDFYKIVLIKNMRIAFIGCTEFINKDDRENQILFCDDDRMLKTIRDITSSSNVDALIVLPHWGVEYQNKPNNYQRYWAKRYLDNGASAVVGSHPHVLQEWEKYKTQDGRETLIIYSLGNFVAAQNGLDRQTGAIAYIGFSKQEFQKNKIFGVAYTPTYRTGTRVDPIGKNDSAEVLKHAELFYGNKNRVEPTEDLKNFLCSLKH